MNGKLYCVSVGPGDPELLTLKAVRLIRQCPVIAVSVKDAAVPRDAGSARAAAEQREAQTERTGRKTGENSVAYQIAAGAVPEIGEKELLPLYMPMTRDKELLTKSHREAAETLMETLRRGRDVAWLNLGDVSIYSTSLYGAGAVEKAGFSVEMVSGVTSFCAAAARLGCSLAEGGEELHVIPSSYGAEEALHYPGVKVLMKAGSAMGKVKKLLAESGYQVQGVERCGMEGEKVYRSLEELEERAGYYTVLFLKPPGTGENR